MLKRVYIESDHDGIPLNENLYAAYKGFQLRGHEVSLFKKFDALDLTSAPIVCGTIPVVRGALMGITKRVPAPIDYPRVLMPWLHRDITVSTLGDVRSRTNGACFIKPVGGKSFAGHVIEDEKDFRHTNAYDDSVEVYVSPVVKFAAEWRVFVLHDTIMGVKHYAGAWDNTLDIDQVQEMVFKYGMFGTAPCAYALDVGFPPFYNDRDDDFCSLTLVEVNDAYSLGSYGLAPTLYAQMIEARWLELVGETVSSVL